MKDDMLAMIAASAMKKELSKTIMINLLAVTRRLPCSPNVLCRTVVFDMKPSEGRCAY
jgi:hypothetical protein